MTPKSPWSSWAPASWLAALLAVPPGPVHAAASHAVASSPTGVEAWLAGDAAGAAAELLARTDRAGKLNRAVALLYAGEALAAEQELLVLRGREPRWVPALRWLARARERAGDPATDATIEALLAHDGADSRDFLWAGERQLEAGQAARSAGSLRAAVAREPDLYLGWLWLGDAEAARGRDREALAAWLRARELHEGGDLLFRLGESSLRAGRREEGRALFEEALATPEGRQREEEIRRLVPDLPPVPPASPVTPPLNPGERLRYTARYLFFRFATLEMENQGFTEFRGSRVARLVFTVRSSPGFPFLSIDSRFESLMAEDGSVLAHRSVSRDSTQADRAAVYEMDRERGECVVRQVVEGLFGFDRLPMPPLDQDGLSVLQLARGVALRPSRLSVLTAVDSTWKGTRLRTLGTERIRWAGRDVETVEVEALGHYKGPAGLSGLVRTWISPDARAVPYRAAVQLGLGSIVLELCPEAGGPED
jgi:tetratricopeptide (TPR) repeat protein